MIMRSQKVLDAQKSGKLTVLFDSGIRTGSDIIKALAIGAQGVLSVSSIVLFVPILLYFCLVARPIVYGLAIAGQAGVEQILMQSICDLHVTMGLCGFSDVNDLIGKRDELLVKVDYGVGTRTLVKSLM